MSAHLPNTVKHGYLELILGPMYSGKTTELIRYYNMYKTIGKSVFAINFSADTRYSDSELSTHSQLRIPCMFTTIISAAFLEIDYKKADAVFINEGQFFPDILETVKQMVEVDKKHVYICGLDGDFKREVFGDLLRLIPFSDRVTKLQSLCVYCRNGEKAIFSHRVSNEQGQVVIGSDNYVPLCRTHYLESNF